MAHRPFNPKDRFASYSLMSVVMHWLSAFFIIVLYVNHSEEASSFHLGLGLIAAPVLFIRVRNRFLHGFPRVSDQSPAFNFGTRFIMVMLLVCILALVVTGVLLPALKGQPYTIFGWVTFSLPLPAYATGAAVAEAIHTTAGHASIFLAAIHLLDAVAQQFYDRSTVLIRMLRPARRGK